MRLVLLTSVVLMAASLHAGAATSPEPETWSPLRYFIGSWSGARTGDEGSFKVTRDVGSSANNRHIQVMERVAGRSGVWGVFSFDNQLQNLVLRQFSSEGNATVLVFDTTASSETLLVFTSQDGSADLLRITYERTSWNEFTERIASAAPGQELAVVSQTTFKRR